MRSLLDHAREMLALSELTAPQIGYIYRQLLQFPTTEQIQVRERLAKDPNCPPDIFALLLPQVRNAALRNPAWSLFLIEGNFLEHLRLTFITASLRDETTPKALLEALALHPARWIGDLARQHVQIVGEAEVGWEEELLTDFTTRLWRDSALVWLMRAGALPETINQRLPYPILPQPRLSEAESQRVVRELALQKGNSLASVLATAQVQSPPQALTEHVHWERRLAMAINPSVTLQKKKLQHDGHVWVRAAARGSEGIL